MSTSVDAFRFITNEDRLSERLGISIGHPIRLFHTDDLGVSFEELRRQVAPSFRDLPWDEYDARRDRVQFLKDRYPGHASALDEFLPSYFAGERDLEEVKPLIDALSTPQHDEFDRIRPFRRRAMATYRVHVVGRDPLRWALEREPDAPFTQAGDDERDLRRVTRRFAASPPAVTEAPAYLALMWRVATLAYEATHGSATSMLIACHQMGLCARPSQGVTNTPEGIHQDGSDYIVSALVIERRNVRGGESIVYGPDKRTEYLRHTLLEGQGIFQADVGSPLWHWATPVHPLDQGSGEEAVRNVLGYDVHLV